MVEDLTQLLFPSQGFASLPLCESDGLVCCVAAGPGGHALRVMLDTGTDPSAIDSGLARRLALCTGGQGLGSGAVSDAVPFTEAVLPWLRLGDLTIRDLYAPAVDLRTLPFGADIVLGYNVLRQLVLRIDYQRATLVLAHPDLGVPPAASATELPLVFFEQFPALEGVEVAGLPIPVATIDTGSNAALTLGPDIASAIGLAAGGADVQVARGAGFGGDCAVLRGSAHAVRIGPLDLRDVELDAPAGGHGDFGRAGRANIGNRLLARFAALTFDYERRTIAIEPRDDAS